jgi:uncharacterized phage protein (predicted DNA packaging)
MENIITLDELKEHLRIERGFTDEDDYLCGLICAAQEAVEKAINRRIAECENATVVHAVKTLAATWYGSREGVSFGTPNRVPYTLDFLLGMNRNYDDCSGIA